MTFIYTGFFLIEITSLFQERPGPIAAEGTMFQTKQLTYTNTTLNKTINTHTVHILDEKTAVLKTITLFYDIYIDQVFKLHQRN